VWLRDGTDRLFHAVSIWELPPQEDGPTAVCGRRVLVVSLLDEPDGGRCPTCAAALADSGGERQGTGSARAWMRVGLVTSSGPMSRRVSGARRRARAEATRSESLWVRLSPDEAAVVREVAARAGMSPGAWVGDTAVDRARAEAARDDADQAGRAGKTGPSSWRELVAALVALRAEAAAVRRVPVVELNPVVPGDALLADQLCSGAPGRAVGDDVTELLRRIDAVTAVAVEATSSAARRSSAADAERSGRS
jgi:hypothetical protein